MTQEPPAAQRVMRFYTVGLLGIGIQLGALAVFRYLFGLPYIMATVLAVEAAVIHNYLWHERWTWQSRVVVGEPLSDRLIRFAKFNLTTGLVSIMANVVLTRLFVEKVGLPLLIANLLAVATASVVTYLCGELFVFPATGIESKHAGHPPYLPAILRGRIGRGHSTRIGRQ
jgi:putative flippase GtrA